MKSPNKQRVLYAEDDADNRLMVSTACGLANIEVVTSETIAEAWRLAQSEHFDLYLLDSRFPDGEGLDLCRRLRRFAPRAPILFYSGLAFEIDRQNGLAAGATDYLIKPYQANLAETIAEAIAKTETPTAESSGAWVKTPRVIKRDNLSNENSPLDAQIFARRGVIETVKGWIDEREANRLRERSAAADKFFGNKLSGKI